MIMLVVIKIATRLVHRFGRGRTRVLTWFAEETFPHDTVAFTVLLKVLGKPYHLHACGEVEHLWVGLGHKALDVVHQMGLNSLVMG